MTDTYNPRDVPSYLRAIRAAYASISYDALKRLLGDCANYGGLGDSSEALYLALDIMKGAEDTALQSVTAYFIWQLGLSADLADYGPLVQLLLHPYDRVRGYIAHLLWDGTRVPLQPAELQTIRTAAEQECVPHIKEHLLALLHRYEQPAG